MTIREALAKRGYGKDRIEEVIKEAKESSNPAYILHYWGINGERYAKQLESES